MEVNSKFQYQTSDTLPIYVNPDQILDNNNVRLRYIKVDMPILIKNMFSFYHRQIFQYNQYPNLHILFLVLVNINRMKEKMIRI
jgi:hypothetical protein